MSIKNTKILIIGGSSGIGLGIAKECANEGAQVTIASRSEKKLQNAISKINPTTKYRTVDVLSKESISLLFDETGCIDHLIITSGFVTAKDFNSLSEDEARKDFETNFWGKFNVCKKGEKYINSGGSITFISGAFAKKLNPDVFMTTISVSAIETLAKTLALSLSPIRVNVISPYIVDTSLVDSQKTSEDREKYLETMAKQLPSKYIGTPKDLGCAAIFLLSNPYMTGSILSIDGGFTII